MDLYSSDSNTISAVFHRHLYSEHSLDTLHCADLKNLRQCTGWKLKGETGSQPLTSVDVMMCLAGKKAGKQPTLSAFLLKPASASKGKASSSRGKAVSGKSHSTQRAQVVIAMDVARTSQNSTQHTERLTICICLKPYQMCNFLGNCGLLATHPLFITKPSHHNTNWPQLHANIGCAGADSKGKKRSEEVIDLLDEEEDGVDSDSQQMRSNPQPASAPRVIHLRTAGRFSIVCWYSVTLKINLIDA